jgi:predicted short-subunit dehydrogenase-like oxidoreductase (DUF2520 family)
MKYVNDKIISHCYTIIGNGRTARHMKFYLQSQNIRVHSWNRKENTSQELQKYLNACDTVLILIKDSEIKKFVDEHPELSSKTLVHFSGSLVIPGIVGLHPLMTFSEKLYSLDFYKKIPFISEIGNETFQDIFPQLANPSAEIETSMKPLYHSLCVMGGNFTTLLWTKLFESFKEKFDFKPDLLFPYLEKISENLKEDYKTALTGPIVRKDVSTMKSNLSALENDSFADIYKSFVRVTNPELYREITGEILGDQHEST